MKLIKYFQQSEGLGILATADAEGKVDVAIYSRPHFLIDGDEELAFIMADRLSYQNLQSNPHAAYLFIEHGQGYTGKRLFLTKIREEADQEVIRALRRRDLPVECESAGSRDSHLVHFRVDAIRPLVGTDH
jgi:hypothetical protein